MYIRRFEVKGDTTTQSQMLQLPAEAPSGVYKVCFAGLQYPGRLHLYGNTMQNGILNDLTSDLMVSHMGHRVTVDGTYGGDINWGMNPATLNNLCLEVPGSSGGSLNNIVAFVTHTTGTPTDVANQEGTGLPTGEYANVFTAVIYRIG